MMDAVGPRVLVFRVATIGDMVVAIPALRAFRIALSPSRVVLLTDEHSAIGASGGEAVLGDSGLIDETLAHRGLGSPRSLATLVTRIRRERFDIALYLPPRERSTFHIGRDRVFFRACGIKRVIGPSGQRLAPRMFAARPLPRVLSEAEDLLEVLRTNGIAVAPLSQGSFDLGIREDERTSARSAFTTAQAASGPFIAVAMGSKWPSKRWPFESFEHVLRRVSGELGLTPVFVGGADDRADATTMTGRIGSGINLCGALSVRASAAAIQRARLFLGNDTGPAHLAYATGTPCVVVCAAQDLPGRWEPFGELSRTLRTEIECAGCKLAQCPRGNECLRVIGPDRVFDACREVNTAALLLRPSRATIS